MYWLGSLVYQAVLGVLALAYLPVFAVRKIWRAGDRLHLRERLGWSPLEPGPERFWVHAVSVGEVVAAVPLVRALRVRWPETAIVVSTVTATGAQMALARLGELAAATFLFPLDLAGAPARALDRVAPRCFIALETELWPTFLGALARRGVPAVLANGRISDRSLRRYRLARPLFRHVLARVALFAMQSEEDARRIISLGAAAERVVVTGNLKMEAPADAAAGDGLWRRLLHLGTDRVWVAGSTHRGEEQAVVEAFLALRAGQADGEPPLRLLLAPRHPERVAEVEALVRERGLVSTRRSRVQPGADVIVLDTVGELAALYAVADVIFIGGSLVPVGGHNVIEPALCARPVVFGPHMHNFREPAALLLKAGGAIQVRGGAELAAALGRLLASEPDRRARGAAAWSAVAAHQGACARTIDALAGVLADAGPRGGAC